jgi:hypothetical protein
MRALWMATLALSLGGVIGCSHDESVRAGTVEAARVDMIAARKESERQTVAGRTEEPALRESRQPTPRQAEDPNHPAATEPLESGPDPSRLDSPHGVPAPGSAGSPANPLPDPTRDKHPVPSTTID